MNYQPGQVLIISWPNSRRRGWKIRTALVVSSLDYNQQGRDVVCACITKNLSRTPENEDIPVHTGHPDYAASRLRFPSMIRSGKLFTFDRSDRHSLLGRFSFSFMEDVIGRITTMFQGNISS